MQWMQTFTNKIRNSFLTIPSISSVPAAPRPILLLGGQHGRHLIDNGLRVLRRHEVAAARVFRISEAPGAKHELRVVVLVERHRVNLLVDPHAVMARELSMTKAKRMRTEEGGRIGEG